MRPFGPAAPPRAEDCLTGTLIDVPVEYLTRLRPICPRAARVAA